MKSNPIALSLLGVSLFVVSCANPYSKFYQPETAATAPRVDKGEPLLFRTREIERYVREYESKGYSVIGTASFHGRAYSRSSLLDQARKVGASLVLYDVEYSHSEQRVLPITQYQPGATITTQQSGYLYSGGASGYYNGQATTQLPGSYSTAFVPYSRTIYEHQAVFLRNTGGLHPPLTSP